MLVILYILNRYEGTRYVPYQVRTVPGTYHIRYVPYKVTGYVPYQVPYQVPGYMWYLLAS